MLRSTIHKGALTLPSLSALVPLVILGRTRSYHHVASTAREETDRFIEIHELLTPSDEFSYSNIMMTILLMAVSRAHALLSRGMWLSSFKLVLMDYE